MAGNSFGQAFRVTTFGESHGDGVGVVIDGCPPQINLSSEDFVGDMARRRPGRHTLDTPRREDDQVEILSGVFEGLTTGAPITLFIRNEDVDSQPYEILRRLFRPGHADYTYFKRYDHFDFRGGGRSSARETAARVAAGVVAKKILEPIGVKVMAYTLELGSIRAEGINLDFVEKNPFYCPDPVASERMEEFALALEDLPDEKIRLVRDVTDFKGYTDEVRGISINRSAVLDREGEIDDDKLTALIIRQAMAGFAVKSP